MHVAICDDDLIFIKDLKENILGVSSSMLILQSGQA